MSGVVLDEPKRRQMSFRVMPEVAQQIDVLRVALAQREGKPVTKGEALEFAVAQAVKRCGKRGDE